ncbi:hypothetical protein Tco_0589837 [Tanacetum coccineum]
MKITPSLFDSTSKLYHYFNSSVEDPCSLSLSGLIRARRFHPRKLCGLAPSRADGTMLHTVKREDGMPVTLLSRIRKVFYCSRHGGACNLSDCYRIRMLLSKELKACTKTGLTSDMDEEDTYNVFKIPNRPS